MCYNSKLLELDYEVTLYWITQQRALYKIVYLIYSYRWFVLATVHPTLNDHVCYETLCVVATTRHSRTNDLTTSKALSRAIK